MFSNKQYVYKVDKIVPWESTQVWGQQRLNRVDLYGKNLIPMEKS